MTDTPVLGQQVAYPDRYAPDVLQAIDRAPGRAALDIHAATPFTGVDVWHAYELSWLDGRGKPRLAACEIRIPAASPRTVESKSLKLYLNSLSGSRYGDVAEVVSLIETDLGALTDATVSVRLSADDLDRFGHLPGVCIDDEDVEITTYDLDPGLLCCDPRASAKVSETLHSHLLKSNCPVTGQPDWAAVLVRYHGRPIDRAALLRYIVSYRHHQEFHEQCVERMFMDIRNRCEPGQLTVAAWYTRRGGIDINPFRSDFEESPDDVRLWRQ